MKTSNKLLLGGLIFTATCTTIAVVRAGLFVYNGQPEYIHLSKRSTKPVIKTLPHENIDGLDLHGFWRVELKRGSAAKISIEAAPHVIAYLSMKRTGGVLRLSQRYFPLNLANRTTLRVTMPSLSSLRIRGGSEVVLSGFRDASMALETRGLNDLKARDCKVRNLRLSGVGLLGLDLSGCRVRNAKLDLRGLGEVNLNMTGGDLSGVVDKEIKIIQTGSVRRRDINVRETLP